MTVCVMGAAVTCGNRGVLALRVSLANLCWRASHGGNVVLVLGNKDNKSSAMRVGGELRQVPVVNCRMSLRSRLCDHLAWILLMSVLYHLFPLKSLRGFIGQRNPWVKTVAEAGFVGDVRGGDSFSDIYGMKRFLQSFLMVWSVLLVRGTIAQFPQTYGPYKSPVARWLARYILKRSSAIIARDEHSRKVAQELVGDRREVLLSPDVAFSLEAVKPERLELEPPLSSLFPTGVIGMNVNGLMYNGGYTRNNMFGLKMDYTGFVSDLVAALLREHPRELWLIPHTYAERGNVESDNEASERLLDCLPAELRHRVRIVTAEYDQHEIKWIIGQCDFFIGSRMHSCIAALSQGVPCVGVAYSMKFGGVFDSVGMGDWVVDAKSSSNAEAVARITSLYQQRNSVREELMRRSDLARLRLDEVFQDLMRPYLAAKAGNQSESESVEATTHS